VPEEPLSADPESAAGGGGGGGGGGEGGGGGGALSEVELSPVLELSLELLPVSVVLLPVSFELEPVTVELSPVALESTPVAFELSPVPFELSPVVVELSPVDPLASGGVKSVELAFDTTVQLKFVELDTSVLFMLAIRPGRSLGATKQVVVAFPLSVTFATDDVSVRLAEAASLVTFESVEFETSARHAGGGVGRSLVAIVYQIFNSSGAPQLTMMNALEG